MAKIRSTNTSVSSLSASYFGSNAFSFVIRAEEAWQLCVAIIGTQNVLSSSTSIFHTSSFVCRLVMLAMLIHT